jgi:hypothetical protein
MKASAQPMNPTGCDPLRNGLHDLLHAMRVETTVAKREKREVMGYAL